jgi:DNA invertase Pin-like site-specific DNA recombinase
MEAVARKGLTKAVTYLRTSFDTNAGADKDSGKRKQAAIETFAKAAGYEFVGSYYDEEVSGTDHITIRPSFAAIMECIASNDARTIIVKAGYPIGRDLIVQETGYAMLKECGFKLVAADKPDAFLDDTPTAKLIRYVLRAVSKFEKALVDLPSQ